jgi:hypothetical protein
MLILHTDTLLPDSESSSELFVYGKQVSDFNTLNKDYLYTINFAATKDLDMIVQNQQSTISGLTAATEGLTTTISGLSAMIQMLCSTMGISATQP